MGRWTENFALLRMSILYICVCVPYVHNPENTRKILRTQLKKGNGRLGKQVVEMARLVNDEENSCRFEVQREEHCYTHDLHGQ